MVESATLFERTDENSFLVGQENSKEFHELINLLAVSDANGN
jgi:hypothetical protein